MRQTGKKISFESLAPSLHARRPHRPSLLICIRKQPLFLCSWERWNLAGLRLPQRLLYVKNCCLFFLFLTILFVCIFFLNIMTASARVFITLGRGREVDRNELGIRCDVCLYLKFSGLCGELLDVSVNPPPSDIHYIYLCFSRSTVCPQPFFQYIAPDGENLSE